MVPQRALTIESQLKAVKLVTVLSFLKPVKAAFIQLNLAPVKCMCADYFRKKNILFIQLEYSAILLEICQKSPLFLRFCSEKS